MKRRRSAKRRSSARRGLSVPQRILWDNALSAFREESHILISREAEDMLKDPKLRAKVDRLTRDFLKALAEAL